MKVLVLNGSPKKKSDTFRMTEAFLRGLKREQEHEVRIVNVIEKAGGAEALGIPNAQIVAKVWKRLNIKVVKAADHVEELKKFGELFGIADAEAVIIK